MFLRPRTIIWGDSEPMELLPTLTLLHFPLRLDGGPVGNLYPSENADREAGGSLSEEI